MQVTYKRDMNHNYMVLELKEESDYQLKMLCANKIKGLLPANTNLFNGTVNVYYDISSRQTISRLYERKELKAEDMKTILFSLQATLDELKKYLLDYNFIVFDPDFCYCNPESRKTEWTFFPDKGGQKGFLKLAEFFIDRVDHQDKAAVDLAYGFFKGMKDDNFVLEELLGREQEETSGYSIEDLDDAIPYEQSVECRERDKISIQPSTSLWVKLKKYISGKVKKQFSGVSYEEGAASHNYYAEDRFMLPDSLRSQTSTGRKEEEEWERYDSLENRRYNGETVVMGMERKTDQRCLKSLNSRSEEEISLSKLPCVFGKMSDCADVVLQHKSVSRMHARIFQKENELYLEDLNSTNGTYINGLALESNEIRKMKPGDEIGFGSLRYLYE